MKLVDKASPCSCSGQMEESLLLEGKREGCDGMRAVVAMVD